MSHSVTDSCFPVNCLLYLVFCIPTSFKQKREKQGNITFGTEKKLFTFTPVACEQASKWSGVKSRAWPGGGKQAFFSPRPRLARFARRISFSPRQAITPVDAYHSIPIVYLQVVDLHINPRTGGAILCGTFLINHPVGFSLHLTHPIHKMLWLVDVIKC